MALFEYYLPELGEGIEEGEVIQILVAVGDSIVKDQPVIELETDKAVIEVPALVDGNVKAIHFVIGDKVKVGQQLLSVETAEAEKPAASGIAPPKSELSRPTADAAQPPLQANVTSSTLPESVQLQADVVSGKTIPPPAAAPPSVRRLAREIGVDINQVTGTGIGGRIGEDDVKSYAKRILSGPQTIPGVTLPVVEQLPDFSRWGAVERHAMTNVRRITAQTMSRAWRTIPHVTQFGKADITELEQLRQRHAERATAQGGKLTLTAILLKVIVAALKRFPEFNASLDMAQHEVIHKHYYHIGVAVDTEYGLLVPVIRDVDRKSLLDLAVELSDVSERARTRKIGLEALQGGTFTITNLGGIGGASFTPIINPPEVAILGVARSTVEPIYREQTFQPRHILPLALSYDHRLIDGADGARFMQMLIATLEDPFLMTLEA
jgi:pyruvate dehydrogenase E2 component (dihydrolipoamide acetyltransferase)